MSTLRKMRSPFESLNKHRRVLAIAGFTFALLAFPATATAEGPQPMGPPPPGQMSTQHDHDPDPNIVLYDHADAPCWGRWGATYEPFFQNPSLNFMNFFALHQCNKWPGYTIGSFASVQLYTENYQVLEQGTTCISVTPTQCGPIGGFFGPVPDGAAHLVRHDTVDTIFSPANVTWVTSGDPTRDNPCSGYGTRALTCVYYVRVVAG